MINRIFVLVSLLAILLFSTNVMAQTATATVTDVNANAGASSSANNSQGQNQGQGQTQQTGVGLNDIGNIKDSFNSQPMRGFGIPIDVLYGPVMNYFGQQTQSVEMQDVANLLTYVNIFSEDSLASAVSTFGPKAELKDVNSYKSKVKAPGKIHGQRWIMVVVTMPKVQIKDTKGKVPQYMGTARAWANDLEEDMAEVMYAMALEALNSGCNILQITAQGATKDTYSKGWGIGFNSVYAHISDGGQRESNVTSGGTGYSAARAGSRDVPWLQGFGLIVPDEELRPGIEMRLGKEEVAKPAVKAAADTTQTGNHKPKS